VPRQRHWNINTTLDETIPEPLTRHSLVKRHIHLQRRTGIGLTVLHLGMVGPSVIDIPSDAADPASPPFKLRDNDDPHAVFV
jgi:hypothetical protein